MACHAVANKVGGPAFKDVAAKYAGQKDAEAKLAQKVQKGSSGTWGPVPMPANPQVSDAEAHSLVKWILAQKYSPALGCTAMKKRSSERFFLYLRHRCRRINVRQRFFPSCRSC